MQPVGVQMELDILSGGKDIVPYATQGVVTEICGPQRLDEECCRKTKACKGTKNERQSVFLPLSRTIGMRFANRAQFRRMSERAANVEFCINR
jgi:hypothetical protein